MGDRIEDARRQMQADIIAAAENKLTRPLTDAERAGIERLNSLMMLESVERSFSSSSTDRESVKEMLNQFSSHHP